MSVISWLKSSSFLSLDIVSLMLYVPRTPSCEAFFRNWSILASASNSLLKDFPSCLSSKDYCENVTGKVDAKSKRPEVARLFSVSCVMLLKKKLGKGQISRPHLWLLVAMCSNMTVPWTKFHPFSWDVYIYIILSTPCRFVFISVHTESWSTPLSCLCCLPLRVELRGYIIEKRATGTNILIQTCVCVL